MYSTRWDWAFLRQIPPPWMVNSRAYRLVDHSALLRAAVQVCDRLAYGPAGYRLFGPAEVGESPSLEGATSSP